MPKSLTRALLFVLTAVLVLAGLGVVTPRAEAAVTGAGYSGITPYGGYLGNYIAPDGYRVYCMDSTVDWPSGSTGGGSLVTSLETAWGEPVHGSHIEKMNYVLTRYGQTDDPTQAAAVSAFIYSYTSTWSHYNGVGHAAGSHYIGGNAVVQGVFDTIWADAEANFRGSPGSATVDIVMASAWEGSVRVATTPAGASGTLTLVNAVATETGESSIPVNDGALVPITGVPATDATSYVISATATFTAASGANQDVVIYYTGSQQRTLRGGTPGTINFSASDETESLELTFSPVVRTAVASTFVEAGDAFVDQLQASAAEGTWAKGTPIVATGTLYGPFAEQPEVASSPPASAPVVGTETLTLSGPGQFSSAGTLTATTAGFYTWVWQISAIEQTPAVRERLPKDYVFTDQFGLVAETHVVPIDLAVSSRVTVPSTGLGGEIGDELSVALDSGTWLSVDGAPVEAVFEGTAYFVAGEVAPVASDTVPADAVALGTATVTAHGPGVYPASSTVTAPEATAGYVTWVWSLSATSPWAAYFEPWADKFGLPDETTRVLPPTVSTLAQPAVAIGDPVHDTATVGGTLPAEATTLVFEAFLQVTGAEPVCDASTLVHTSAPVEVTSLGEWSSPTTTFTEYGTYYWIESLYSAGGELIHRGECGLPDETTIVAPGEVATVAKPAVALGELAHDTASVSGLVPTGATLVFEAFVQNSVDGPLCDATTRVFTSTPIPAEAAGEYVSPSTRFEQPGTYFWVETLLDRNDEPLHVGECGAEGETTVVSPPALASTGASLVHPLVVGIGLVGIGVFVVTFLLVYRRTRRS